ncbi:MAG: hypothetical protein HXY19_02095 [Thermoanaerobaculaceae bacterium]|nr:hypothetical protein [Thermoanaerobaculaceae bacterium]
MAAERHLLVLADGVQAGFAAGVLAELERHGVSWERGAGAGLGGVLAVRALLGEGAAAAAEWLREAESGCPLLASQVGTAQARLGFLGEVVVLPDPWRLSGWLDGAALDRQLEAACQDWPGRLLAQGRRCDVAVADLSAGVLRRIELSQRPAGQAAHFLRAAAAFPGGWGPVAGEGEESANLLAGGVEAAGVLVPLLAEEPVAWDVVCGFSVPAVPRPGLASSLLEQVQRRGEMGAAALVADTVERHRARVRLFAPTAPLWQEHAARDGAELGVEYPLPWERNGELLALLVGFGRFVARRVVGLPGGSQR